MQLASQLYAAGVKVFPCRADKSPAVNENEHWADRAQLDPSESNWPTGLVGVPVPPGVVVIDLDTYKGVTREVVEHHLGVALPWDAALIQHTFQGGQHYAFAVDWPVRQGANLKINGVKVPGLDTRSGGKGYIATGDGYTSQGFGLFALAHPESLPKLPAECRATMEHLERTPIERTAPPTADETDVDAVRAALAFVSPDCGRSEWVKIGMALRHYFAADEETGLALFDAWSGGEYWRDGCPPSYDGDSIEHQWGSFKADGDTTSASLFYEAIQGGWVPPKSFDTASAFGEGAAPSEPFNELIDRIAANGGDPKHTADLMAAIQAMACNALQRATLVATLQREAKDAGLLTKPMRVQLDAVAGVAAMPRVEGTYGKNHTENATMFLERHYPGGRLVRSDEVWYEFNGKIWGQLDDDLVRHKVTCDMAPSMPMLSTVSGTYGMLAGLVHLPGHKIGDTPGHLTIFENGVLDLTTGVLLPHDQSLFTTNILPYSYRPAAECGRWLTFLGEVFEGDAERVALLQEWFGYMLTSSYAHHKILMMLGPGRCGKGTIGRVLERVVGAQNYTGGSLRAFTSDSFLESLRTKRVMFMADVEKHVGRGMVGQVIESIKKISGNDAVSFERKYKSTLSETLPTRMTIAGNNVPNLFDDSGALAGRMMVLPFHVSFYGREDPYLFDALLADLEGIAIWSLQGMARLNQQGKFTAPESAQGEAQFIAEAFSPLRQFLSEVCTLGTSGRVTCPEIHGAYKAWALANGEDHLLGQRPFISAFKDLTRGSGCRYGSHRMEPSLPAVRGFSGVTLGKVDSTTSGAFQPAIVGGVK
jgi:P4 family phage/plasmid primase-like protien